MNKKSLFLSLSLFLTIFAQQQLFAQASGTNPQLYMYRHNGSLGNSPSPALSGNTIGTIEWRALTTINGIRNGATIRSIATNVSPNFLMGNLIFSTSGPLGIRDRMIITDAGLVGVGTMTPEYHFDVVGNTHTSGRFYGRIHFDTDIPTDLPGSYNDEAYFERKSRLSLGLGANAISNGGILTMAPGGGSLDRQIFSGGTDGMWTRSQTNGADSWSAWEKFLTSADIHGNVGRVARFTGATLGDPSSTLGNSQLFDDGTRVGIGTNSPDGAFLLTVGGSTKLDGNARATGNLQVDGNASANNLSVAVNANVAGNTGTGSLNVAANASIGNLTTTQFLQVNNNATVNGETRLVGKVAIGADPISTPGGYALYVGGSAIAEEVVVKLKSSWPDYVFAPEYRVKPLSEVEAFIAAENHLPGVPSANEIAENGVNLGAMQQTQMEKIEELYLHMIAMEKRIQTLEAENAALKAAKKH